MNRLCIVDLGKALGPDGTLEPWKGRQKAGRTCPRCSPRHHQHSSKGSFVVASSVGTVGTELTEKHT